MINGDDAGFWDEDMGLITLLVPPLSHIPLSPISSSSSSSDVYVPMYMYA